MESKEEGGVNRAEHNLEAFLLAPWARRRRKDLLELLDRLNSTITELSSAIEQEAKKQAAVARLMTHPG
jgi:transposase